MECVEKRVVGTAKQESVPDEVVCWGVFWDGTSNVGTVDDFIHGPELKATLDDIASHIPPISTIPPHSLPGASKRGDYLNDKRLGSHRHDTGSRGGQAYCSCRATVEQSLGGPRESIMIGAQNGQAETQKSMRLEHKALDEKARKPGNTSRCIPQSLATFITSGYHITSAGGALYKAILKSRDFRKYITGKSINLHQLHQLAKSISDQSTGFLNVTWLGGVLDLPGELKRLVVHHRYLAQRRSSHILPAHVMCSGVTLSANY